MSDIPQDEMPAGDSMEQDAQARGVWPYFFEVLDEQQLVILHDLDLNDLTEFNSQKSSIPDEYRIQFNPPVPDEAIPGLELGDRFLYTVTVLEYQSIFLPDGTFVSEPVDVIQQFLAPAQPAQPQPEPDPEPTEGDLPASN